MIRATPVGEAIFPVGGRTRLDLGNPPIRSGRAVDLRSLQRVIDFPARDMTVTVEAGMTAAELQAMLARENLQLPIDVPRSDEATIGGIIATNTSGPRRLGYGTLRDYVIGISAINDEGREFKAGGRVVKNVAGYDLCKLLVGSLGTLGIITQATFKLKPLAEEQALVTFPCTPDKLDATLTEIHGSQTRPVLVEVLNPSAASVVCAHASLNAPATGWLVVVGFDGNHDAVAWQVEKIVAELGVAVSAEVLRGQANTAMRSALVEHAAWPDARASFKCNLLSSATAAFCTRVNDLSPVALQAHAGSGIVRGHLSGDITKDRAATLLGVWRELAASGRGRVIVERCPPEWKNVVSVWGPIGGEAWLMREVKEKFDPRGIFNPGRFYHDI